MRVTQAQFERLIRHDKGVRKAGVIGKPKVLEKWVKKAVLDYLTLIGCFAWNNPSGGTRIPGGEGKKDYFVMFGKKGSPDIIGVLPGGKFIGVETKASKDDGTSKERRRLQDEFGAEIRKRGGVYVRAKSVDDVIGALKPLGLGGLV